MPEPVRWSFRQSPTGPLEQLSHIQIKKLSRSDDGFTSVSLPTEVHVELLKSGEIPDPFLRDNENAVQWVAEQSWVFKGVLKSRQLEKEEKAHLVLDRVDTFALLWLDGELVHENINGLDCEQRIDVTRLMQKGGKHVLMIQFLSPVLKARLLMKESEFKATAWNGEPSRCYARKLQYHWGWDWGPRLVSIGIQGGVTVEISRTRIADFYPRFELDDDLKGGIIRISGKVEGDLDSIEDTLISLEGPIATESIASARLRWDGGFDWEVPRPHIHLWSVQDPTLYTVGLLLLGREGRVLDSQQRRIGARKFRVLQDSLERSPGTSFVFELNGSPLFAGGSNWVPDDSFLTRTSKERIRRWLQLAKDGNQNVVRVWGGGAYEKDDFYDLCDEIGLLVWQDIPFACGLYPADDAFYETVKKEARSNLRRLRHHPSLVVLAGNNEDYQVAEANNAYRSTDEWRPDKFPAKNIYEELLPSLAKEVMGDAVYFPGCPWSGGDTRDVHRGDNHCWEVWHGSMQPYQNWDRLFGRFESEWGMQAFPDIHTIDYWLDGAEDQRTPTSKLVRHHQKADGGEDRLNKYIDDNFVQPSDLERYVYISQLMQSDCVSAAMQTWRRGFKGPRQYECAGSVIWQLNDCWPVISWSIVDYFLRPKAAYFSMKRGLAPLACGAKRRPARDGQVQVEIWISNTDADDFIRLEIVTEVFDIESGNLVQSRLDLTNIDALSCLELGCMSLSEKEASRHVVSMRVVDARSSYVLARLVNWPDPMKDVKFARPDSVGLKVELHNTHIAVKAERPVKGLTFSFPTDDVRLLDNCVDLAPRQKQRIPYEGKLTAEVLSWRDLGDGYE